jgi:hypothetical protein
VIWSHNSRERFDGWYYKHQARGRSLAIIPGRAGDGGFIHVITDDRSASIPYTGDNSFSERGISLNINHPGLTLTGEIGYTGITPIRGDIMGPFRFFPMECRHSVVSMKHDLSGSVTLNGEVFDFNGGIGYIEGDSGRSFPDGYAWVQCNDFKQNCSIMASAARIPFCGLKFTGCICVVWLDGREYRLATYNGVKIERCEQGHFELRQGKYRLTVSVVTGEGLALPAPDRGTMSRVIRENLSCAAHFRFTEGGRVLFEESSDRASYEYVPGL